MRFVIKLVSSQARIFQTLNTGIDYRADNQNLSDENKPEHHDHHDNGTEETNVHEVINIVVDIDWKDIEQEDQGQQDKGTSWQYMSNSSHLDIGQEIIKHDQDGKNQGIGQGTC